MNVSFYLPYDVLKTVFVFLCENVKILPYICDIVMGIIS